MRHTTHPVFGTIFQPDLWFPHQENIIIGDALLQAIREGVYKLVEMLIDHDSITKEMLSHEWANYRTKVHLFFL